METRLSALRGRGLHLFLFWVTVIVVVMVDQATKAAAVKVANDVGRSVLIPGVVNLVHVENTGAAFSIGEGGGVLFVLVAIAFLVGACWLVWREEKLPVPLVIAVAMVAGGGLGNMIDRIMNGSVTDFISTAFMRFPVFNVADMCVTVGVAISVVGYWVWDARREATETEPEQIQHANASAYDTDELGEQRVEVDSDGRGASHA